MAQTHRRTITNGPVRYALPDPVGEVDLRYRVPDLTWTELELDPYLDRMNPRLEARGEEPFESVWDALEELTGRYPMAVTGILLRGAVRHLGPGTDALVDELPPWIYNDEDLGDRLNAALSIAFGADPSELDQEVSETEDPTVAGGDAGGSTGEPSTPSGPAPSRPEA